MWAYCADSARYIFGDAVGDAIADRTVDTLRQTPDGVSRTDLHRLYGNNASAGRLDTALGALLTAGRVPGEHGRLAEMWHAVPTAQQTTAWGDLLDETNSTNSTNSATEADALSSYNSSNSYQETDADAPADPLPALRAAVGRRVQTPAGPGRLEQVFANRLAVALDHDPARLAYFADPAEIEALADDTSPGAIELRHTGD